MQINRIYLDVDMRQNFQGLSKILANDKIILEELTDKSFILFMNRKMTAFKFLIGKDYLVFRNNQGKKIDPRVAKYFPKAFNGSTLDFTKAVREMVEAKFGKTYKG